MTAQSKKIAVVGLGYWGQKLAAASLRAGLEVVVVDTVQRDVAAYPQVSWEVALADTTVSGVIVATPEKTHAALVTAALQAHKAVLVEKPATTSVESWKVCVDLAIQNNLPLLVDYTFLYSQALQQWQDLQQRYANELGTLKQLTTVRKTQMTPDRIADKALPIWWDVVIHDLYLLRAVFNQTPTDWKVLTAQLPGAIKTQANLGTLQCIADYSWLVTEPERSWLAEYERGSLLWQRVPEGEAFEVKLNGEKIFTTVIADQNPSPLDTLLKNWLELWPQKNLQKIQKKHWQAVTQDIITLTELSDSLTAQVATRQLSQE